MKSLLLVLALCACAAPPSQEEGAWRDQLCIIKQSGEVLGKTYIVTSCKAI